MLRRYSCVSLIPANATNFFYKENIQTEFVWVRMEYTFYSQDILISLKIWTYLNKSNREAQNSKFVYSWTGALSIEMFGH